MATQTRPVVLPPDLAPSLTRRVLRLLDDVHPTQAPVLDVPAQRRPRPAC